MYVVGMLICMSSVAVEDRKDWLRAFKVGTHADYNVESVTYESFINKELILFSVSFHPIPGYEYPSLTAN